MRDPGSEILSLKQRHGQLCEHLSLTVVEVDGIDKERIVCMLRSDHFLL